MLSSLAQKITPPHIEMVFHSFDRSLDTSGQYGKLLFIALRREILPEASAWEGCYGRLRHELAPAALSLFDSPLDSIIGL